MLMKTTSRFDNAIQKLYEAFHNNTLNPECCSQCAVGNILDNATSWQYLSDHHGSMKLNYVGLVNQKFGKRFGGYTPLELLQIEKVFLEGCGYQLPLHHQNYKPKMAQDKEVLFGGLSAVVSFLCKLDGIEDVMDCSRLFNYNAVENHAKVLQ